MAIRYCRKRLARAIIVEGFNNIEKTSESLLSSAAFELGH